MSVETTGTVPPTDPTETAVQLTDVSFGYDRRRPILRGIDMTIPRGKLTAIMGGSGCGKTTILRLIGGQLRPQRGSVVVAGKDVAALDRDRAVAMDRGRALARGDGRGGVALLDGERAVAGDGDGLVAADRDVLVGGDRAGLVVADRAGVVVEDDLVQIALGVDEDLLATLRVLETQLVEAAAAGCALGLERAARLVLG